MVFKNLEDSRFKNLEDSLNKPSESPKLGLIVAIFDQGPLCDSSVLFPLRAQKRKAVSEMTFCLWHGWNH